MRPQLDTRITPRGCAIVLALSLLAGCSSSFGGGSEPSQPATVVVPAGSAAVCQNGSAPPCGY